MIRAIEAVALAASPKDERGPVPELRWIDIAELRVDGTYQRSIGRDGLASIKRIARDFDWRMFGPVVVSPMEGGVYAVVDGQHRTTAALSIGVERVPCLVIQADRVMQAKAFAAINGQVTRVSSQAIFRSRLAAGDAAAVRVRTICTEASVRMLTSNTATNYMEARETCACACLERMYAAHGEAILLLALRCIVASAHDVPGLFVAVVIQAFCEVLVDHPEWAGDVRLVDLLRGFDLAAELRQARDGAKAKRMPVLPFVQAMLVTWCAARLDRPAVAA